MDDKMLTLLAAASCASSAATDMIEEVREGRISAVGAGETLVALADAIRLLLDAVSVEGEDETQLQGAVIRFLDAQT